MYQYDQILGYIDTFLFYDFNCQEELTAPATPSLSGIPSQNLE